MYQFGGIYLDTDSVFVKPFPPVLQTSFVTHTFSGYNNICNCVFGMAKNSPFLRFALESLKLNYEKHPGYQNRDFGGTPTRTGPVFLTAMLVNIKVGA